jgi:hypothetical protein
LRDVLGRSAEPATKLVKLGLKLALFVLKFSIQDLNDPLVKVPEVIKLHLLQFSVFHAQPQGNDPTRNAKIAKEKPPGGGLPQELTAALCEIGRLALPPVGHVADAGETQDHQRPSRRLRFSADNRVSHIDGFGYVTRYAGIVHVIRNDPIEEIIQVDMVEIAPILRRKEIFGVILPARVRRGVGHCEPGLIKADQSG